MTLLNMQGWTVILPPQCENGKVAGPQLALLGLECSVKQAREVGLPSWMSWAKKALGWRKRPASINIHMVLAVGLQGELMILAFSPSMRFVQLAQPVMDIGGAQAPKIVSASEQDGPLPFPPPQRGE